LRLETPRTALLVPTLRKIHPSAGLFVPSAAQKESRVRLKESRSGLFVPAAMLPRLMARKHAVAITAIAYRASLLAITSGRRSNADSSQTEHQFRRALSALPVLTNGA
jgi:hypothetical protein